MKMVSGQTLRLVTALLVLAAILLLDISCSSPLGPLLNQTPVISNLTTDKETVDPSGTAKINCDARDPDRDELTYIWAASGGTISGDGLAVDWTAPQKSGTYTITVTVDDGKGGKATKEVSVGVLVAGNSPPYIKSLTYDPFIKYDDETTIVTCVAVDPDGDEIISYTWGSTNEKGEPAGTFEGKGAVVKWIPPQIPTEIYCTISVFCTDSVGNRSTRKFMTMHVYCACTRPEISGK